MKLANLRKLVAKGESEELEFKSSTGDLKGGMETLCGFLNFGGGSVLFGVRANGHIVGQSISDATLREVASELAKLDPPATITSQRVAVSATNEVLILGATSRTLAPYTYAGRPFQRVASTTRRMPQTEYHRRLLERDHTLQRWENQSAEGYEFYAADPKSRSMIEQERTLAINRAGWDRAAPSFHGGTALPEYGPLAPTEDTLRLLELAPGMRVLELGCGSGHSLLYLAEHGAGELWGLDFSPVQIAFAKETLRPFAARCRLFESPMEVNPGIPAGHFDLVFSLWGLGWTTDLPATLALIADYLKPGGCFLFSGEHPAYSCVQWDGEHYIVSEPYCAQGPREHASWMGAPIVTQRHTLGAFVTQVAQAGLRFEALIEGEYNGELAKESHADPARWYCSNRARLVPTTFIIKARKCA